MAKVVAEVVDVVELDLMARLEARQEPHVLEHIPKLTARDLPVVVPIKLGENLLGQLLGLCNIRVRGCG